MSTVSQNLELLNMIGQKYSPSKNDYEKIKEKCAKKVFSKSKNGTLYGMFFPYPEMQEYFIYNGKIVGEKARYDSIYYFDKDNKLLLTEIISTSLRKSSNKYIFFYYFDSYVDCVSVDSLYNPETVGRYESKNGKLIRYIEAYYSRKKELRWLYEYLFGLKRRKVIRNSYFAETMGHNSKEFTILFSRLMGA